MKKRKWSSENIQNWKCCAKHNWIIWTLEGWHIHTYNEKRKENEAYNQQKRGSNIRVWKNMKKKKVIKISHHVEIIT